MASPAANQSEAAFTVAYLKRALDHLHKSRPLGSRRPKKLLPETMVTEARKELFEIREGILRLMDEFRDAAEEGQPKFRGGQFEHDRICSGRCVEVGDGALAALLLMLLALKEQKERRLNRCGIRRCRYESQRPD